MEHRGERDSKGRPFHIHDNTEQLAMIMATNTGDYQIFGQKFKKIGTLDEALDYLEKWPWGNIIIKVDTIKASLL